MAHLHWCDVTGHEWECQGAALRPLRGDTEPTPCYCINHQTLMEDGDHCQCSIELIACEEHRDQQLRAMGYEPGQAIEPPTQGPEESSMFKDGDHCQCSIELIACEEHRDQQLRAMGYEPGQAIEPPTQGPEESSMFKD